MTTPLIQPLRPFVDPLGGTGRGPVLRVVEVTGGVEVGIVVPGHAEMRGGVISPEDLVVLGQRLVEIGNRLALERWRDVQAYTQPSSRNGEDR